MNSPGSSTCSLFFRVERASMLHYCWLFSPASPRALCLSASDKSFFNSPLFVQLNWSNCLHSARWLIVFPAPCFRFEMKKGEGSGGAFWWRRVWKNTEQRGKREKVGAVNGVQELHYERDYGAARRKVSACNDSMGNRFCSDYGAGGRANEITASPRRGWSRLIIIKCCYEYRLKTGKKNKPSQVKTLKKTFKAIKGIITKKSLYILSCSLPS